MVGAKACQHVGLLEIHPENFRQVANVKMPQMRETVRAKTAGQLIKEYHDVSEGDLGALPGTQRLEVDPNVTPTTSPSRRVPLALKPRLKQELERLTSLRVIAPVDSPTDWVSNVVVATKPSGDIRICIDPKGLNKALKRERYPRSRGIINHSKPSLRSPYDVHPRGYKECFSKFRSLTSTSFTTLDLRCTWQTH